MSHIPTRVARQEQAREATRRAILDAALELFVTEGYPHVSIRNIAGKVEYSPGAIYSYFPSKDDIFVALAEEGFRLLGAAHLSEPETGDPLKDLANTARQLYDFSKRHPEYFALVFLDRRVPRVGPESQRFTFMSEIKQLLVARVQRCVDEGVLPPALDVGVALRLLLLGVIGVAGLRLSGRLLPGEDPDMLVRDAIDTTIAGLRAGTVLRSQVLHHSCESSTLAVTD